MSPREDLDRFTTDTSRGMVAQFIAESADEDDHVDMDEVVRQNLADHEAALAGNRPEPADDWTALRGQISKAVAGRPDVRPDIEPERLAQILAGEKRPSSLDVVQIASAFGVTVSWLLTGSDHGMCEGTIAALQEELRRSFEHSQRQDDLIADLKQQLLNAQGHGDDLGEQMRHRKSGVYRLYWKSGGSSVAAVGMLYDGAKWYAPANWTLGAVDADRAHLTGTDWSRIERAELIEAYRYVRGPEPEGEL